MSGMRGWHWRSSTATSSTPAGAASARSRYWRDAMCPLSSSISRRTSSRTGRHRRTPSPSDSVIAWRASPPWMRRMARYPATTCSRRSGSPACPERYGGTAAPFRDGNHRKKAAAPSKRNGLSLPAGDSAFRADRLLDVVRQLAQGRLGLFAASRQQAGGDPCRVGFAAVQSTQDDGGDRRAGRVERLEAVAVLDQEVCRPFDLHCVARPRYGAHAAATAQLSARRAGGT